MTGPVPVPASLRAATALWLLTVPVCLTLGVTALVSLTPLIARLPTSPAAPMAPGVDAGQAHAALVLLAVLTAALQVAFAAVALAYAAPLHRPGWSGRRARTILTLLAAAGIAATVTGYLAGGTVPFAGGKNPYDLLHDSLETLWALPALVATALSFTTTARRHLRSQESRP